jgi:hypothetical protein
MKDSISRWIDGDMTPAEADGALKRLLANDIGA